MPDGKNPAHSRANTSQSISAASYRDAALVTLDAQEALDQAGADLAALPVPARDLTSIDAEMAALDPLAEGYADRLATLEAERDAVLAYDEAATVVDAAAGAVDAAQAAEDAALLTASGGEVLSAEALAYIRSELEL